MYTVIYDGTCNLCVTLVRLLEQLDQGKQLQYVPMQQTATLQQWQISPQDCEQGMSIATSSLGAAKAFMSRPIRLARVISAPSSEALAGRR